MSHGTDWLAGRDDARELAWAMDVLHDRANRTCPKCGHEGVYYYGCFGCEQIANRAAIAKSEGR